MTQINGDAPLRDLSASADPDLVRRIKTMEIAFKTSQEIKDRKPLQFLGSVAQSGADKRFDKDGFKVLHVSENPFGVYRVPVVAVPEIRRLFSKLQNAVVGAHMAGKTGRRLRAHEVEDLDTAFALLEDIQEELKKC